MNQAARLASKKLCWANAGLGAVSSVSNAAALRSAGKV
jgi:hypothetical protein